MNKQLVSIIIPMYNAQATINRCIRSIQAQTYYQVEIIVIDDGSSDSSTTLVNNLAKEDQRIKLHSQKNHGPSHARNKGLTLATGDFIQFVDADDWMKETMVDSLIAYMDPTIDLVICGYQTESQTVQALITGVYDRQKWLASIGALYQQTLLPSPCNKLYRREIIDSANITFPAQYALGEDLLFNLHYLSHCDAIALMSDAPYMYCYEATSLTRKYIPNLFIIQKQLHERFITFLREEQSATTANINAANHVFIQGTAYAISNIYHLRSPLTQTEKYKALRYILADETVQRISSPNSGILPYFIRRKRYLLAHVFYLCKGIVKDIRYHWRQRS